MGFLINDRSISTGEKIQLGISYLLQLSLLGAIVFAVYRKNWETSFLTLCILFLTSLPSLFRRSYKVRLPIELDFTVIVFIYAALFLGEVKGYYTIFWWWDVLLHTSSGILFGIFGFLLVYVLNEEKKIRLNLKPFFVALFSFALANAVGAIWEIFEYSMDSFFGLNMQSSGLADTMWDLIVNLLGSLVVVTLGYLYLKSDRNFFRKIINKYL